jgi:signal transduction histidine kinase
MATILVVDDRSANREALVTLLEYKGHRMLEASDGRDALAVVRAEGPDLVICDILMPTMDGYEFVRELRADPGIATTRVIFYTAHYHAREAHNLARAATVSHVLTKPCEPEEVFRVVDEALNTGSGSARPAPAGDYDREHLRLVTDKLFGTVHELSTANERLRALVDLNLQLASLRDPLQLLEDVCRGARELIGARYAAIGIRDQGNGDTTRFVTSGIPAEVASGFGRPTLHKGVFGTVIEERSAVRLPNSRRGRQVPGLPRGYPPVHCLVAAPIASPSTVYGWICLTDKLGADEFSGDDELLLSVLATLVGRGYESGSFYARVQRQAAEQLQTLSRRLVEVQESERRQLSRELHDRVGQNLTALGINLDILRTQGSNEDRAELRARLEDSIALVEATAEAIENVMAELRPPMLDDRGLLSALQWYAKQFSQRTGIDVTVRGEEPAQRPGQEIEITLFRIAQEALNNVAKHAHAARVDVALEQLGSECVLSLSDDGVGFDPQALSGPGRGMATMRERVQSVGGHLEIRATPDHGTHITAKLPLLV